MDIGVSTEEGKWVLGQAGKYKQKHPHQCLLFLCSVTHGLEAFGLAFSLFGRMSASVLDVINSSGSFLCTLVFARPRKGPLKALGHSLLTER